MKAQLSSTSAAQISKYFEGEIKNSDILFKFKKMANFFFVPISMTSNI
jgi:hypothetical protein